MDTTPASLLEKRLSLAQDFQRPKFAVFSEIDAIVHVKGKDQPGVAQIHSPDSWAAVETVAPRMVSRRPTVIYKPREDGEDAGAEANQALFNYWWDKDRAFSKTVITVKSGLQKGKAMVKWYWKNETQTVKSYVYGPDRKPALEAQVIRSEGGEVVEVLPIEGILNAIGGDITQLDAKERKFAEKEEEVTTFDDPCMELINMYDFFIDPEATSIQDAQWIIFRYRKSLQELKSYKKFKNLGQLEVALTGNSTETGDTENFKDTQRLYSGTGNLQDDSTVDRVTCYEMWEMGPKGKRVTTVACKIEIEPWTNNPYWHGLYPFSEYVDSVTGYGFWDFCGEIEPVMGMQYALDTLVSLDLDNRMRAIDPKWKVDGNVDEREIFEGPVIHTDTKNGDDVTPIEVPDLTGTSMAGIESMKQSFSNALGIFDVSRGDSPDGNTTASGIATVAEQGNARFGLKLQHLEDFFKDMGFFVMSLYQQHLTDEKVVRILGEDGAEEMVRLMPQDIAGGYDIDIEAGSSKPANREAERTDALQQYQLVMGTPVAQDPQFQMEAIKFALEKFDGSSELVEAAEAAFERLNQQQQMMMEQEQMMLQDQQAQMGEEVGVQDHATRMQYYENEDQKLQQEIAQVEEGLRQEADRELEREGMAV